MFISDVLAWQALARIVDEFAMLAIEQAQRVAWVKTVVYGVFVEVTAQHCPPSRQQTMGPAES